MKKYVIALLVAIGGAWGAVGTTAQAQQSAPEIPFDGDVNFFKLPADMNFGEASGVAVNSKGQIAVFTRSNSANGPAYGATASQVLLFDQNGKFIKEIGKGSTRGRTHTRSASTRTTICGPSTKART